MTKYFILYLIIGAQCANTCAQVGINTQDLGNAIFYIDGKGDNSSASVSANTKLENDVVIISSTGNMGIATPEASMSRRLTISSTDAALMNAGVIRIEGGTEGQVLGSNVKGGFMEWKNLPGAWRAWAENGYSSGGLIAGTPLSPIAFPSASINSTVGSIAWDINSILVKVPKAGIYEISVSGISSINGNNYTSLVNSTASYPHKNFFIAGYVTIQVFDKTSTLIRNIGPHTIGDYALNNSEYFSYSNLVNIPEGGQIRLYLNPSNSFANVASDVVFSVSLTGS